MGMEIAERSKETRIKRTSMLNTQRSLFILNGYGVKTVFTNQVSSAKY